MTLGGRMRPGVKGLLTMAVVCSHALSASAGIGFPSQNVTLLSHLDLDDFPGGPTSGNDCWGYVSPSGREYALMGLRNEVAVVEITSPSNPVIIAEIPHSSSNWCDIKVWQDHAYAVNEESGGMDVIDLSQVDSGVVTLVQRVTDLGLQTSHNIAIDTDSGFAYLCSSNLNGGRLVAFDLSNPDDPVFAGQISSIEGADVHDTQVVTYTSGPYAGKEIAYASVGPTGLDIYDVTDKANMFRLSRTTYPNLSFAHQCWADENRQYLYLNDELDGVNETVIFDISDLSNPFVAGTYTSGVPATDHNVYVHQGFIYEAEYTAGLRIFDAADPLNPVQVGWFDTHPATDAAVFNGAWSNYPYFPSGNVIISTKDAGMFVVRPGPAPLAFSYPDGLPVQLEPGGDSFLVEITGQDGEELDPDSPLLHYDAGAGLVEAPMQLVQPGLYEAAFGPIECGEFVQYFVSAATESGITLKDPISAPSPAFSAIAGSAVNIAFDDDMEADAGWTVGAAGDTATGGIWTRVDPNGNGSAPEIDHTPEPGTMCFVTGQDPPGSFEGNNDVDDGVTTLLTPVFDLGGASEVTISYWRWYDNDFFQFDGDEGNGPNEDVFTIDISNDNGQSWVNVETIGPAGPQTSGGWLLHALDVGDFVAPSSQVRMRFVASDFGNFSVVEAAVDDFQVAIVSCAVAGDINGDGAADIGDIGPFTDVLLGTPQAPEHAARADLNGDGTPNGLDTQPFVDILLAL